MPRYIIDENEDWPVYDPREVPDNTPAGVEIPDDVIEHFNEAAEAWQAAQEEMGEYREQSEKLYAAWREDPAHTCAKMTLEGWSLKPLRCYTTLVDGKCPWENRVGWHVDEA